MKITSIIKQAFPVSLLLAALASCQEQHGHRGADTATNASGMLNSGIMLTDNQMRLANITTQAVTRKSVGQAITINGRLTHDARQSEVISSRGPGRLDKLFIKESGQTVTKGQPLYTLYSETLLTLQREYLLAKEQYETVGTSEKRYRSFLEAAERKLILYGLTKKQIDQVAQSKRPKTAITFLSPSAGIITQVNASEGQYVAEGTALYRIENIETLWVEADLYPSERHLVKTGDKIFISVNGSNNQKNARVEFLSPAYTANSLITIMRASVENSDLRLKSGQPVQLHLIHSSKEALSIPADAVIRDGNGTHVYVQRGHHTFIPKIVRTGVENFKEVEITEGLDAGDTIAVSGAYLLYSETVLKKGTDPMAQHRHKENVVQ